MRLELTRLRVDQGSRGRERDGSPEGAKTNAESPALQEFACPQLAKFPSFSGEQGSPGSP
jgi:hypothetical protein